MYLLDTNILLDIEPPDDIDGISTPPTLLGRKRKQKKHKLLYWELGGRQGIRMGDWKAVCVKPWKKIGLYNLAVDISEQNDVADERPAILEKMVELFVTARTESDTFTLPRPKPAVRKRD